MANQKTPLDPNMALFATTGVQGSTPELQAIQQEILKKIYKKLEAEENDEEEQKRIKERIRQQMIEGAKRAEADKDRAQMNCDHYKRDSLNGTVSGSALAGQRDHQGYTRLFCQRCLKEYTDAPDPVTGKKPKNPWPHDIGHIAHRIGGPQTI